MEKTVNQPVTPEITLLGYSLSHPPHTGDGWPLAADLFWQAVTR